MERFYIIAPALIPSVYMSSMLLYFALRTMLGKQPAVQGLNRRKFSDIIGPFLTAYFLWLLEPIERAMLGRVPPNVVTFASLVFCAIGGAALATGHLATAGWAYILAGASDVLDGRLARATNSCSRAGAFLDSVSDRWGELLIFTGAAWYLRDSVWLGAVMLAVSGSMMVSYTRARGEGLDLSLDGGTMQRAERVLIVAVGILVAAWFDAAVYTAHYSAHIVGVALFITGFGSAATSVHRWWSGYKQLVARDAEAAAAGSAQVAKPPGDGESVVIPFERERDSDDKTSEAGSSLSPSLVVSKAKGADRTWAAAAGALEPARQRVRE